MTSLLFFHWDPTKIALLHTKHHVITQRHAFLRSCEVVSDCIALDEVDGHCLLAFQSEQTQEREREVGLFAQQAWTNASHSVSMTNMWDSKAFPCICLLPTHNNPWRHDLCTGDDQAMITLTGFSQQVFHYLVNSFTPLFDAYSSFVDEDGYIVKKMSCMGHPPQFVLRIVYAYCWFGATLKDQWWYFSWFLVWQCPKFWSIYSLHIKS